MIYVELTLFNCMYAMVYTQKVNLIYATFTSDSFICKPCSPCPFFIICGLLHCVI
jgi:hypothetical protein